MFSDTTTSDSSANLKDSEEISLKDVVLKLRGLHKFLTSKRKIIFLFFVIGGVVGFLYAYYQKPVYIATTTFVLEEGDKSAAGGLMGQYSNLASLAGIDMGGSGGIFQGENILQLYVSRSMIQKALLSRVEYNGNKDLLVDRFIKIKKLRERWANIPKLRSLNFLPTHDQPLSRLQDSILGDITDELKKNNLTVNKPDKKLSIIMVNVKSEDESFSKDFNDQIVKTVNDFYVQTKTKKALQNLAILQHQTDSVRSVLNGALYQSVSITDATPNLNPSKLILRAPAQRSQFNAEANKAILTQLVQNLELAKISLRRETPLIQIIDVPIYPLTESKVSKVINAAAGAFLLGFITVVVLIIRKVISSVLNS